jgi:hypothetical protein
VREQTMKQGESEGWIWKSYISRTHRNLCSCKIGNTYQLIDDLRISELVDSPVYANSATNPYMVCFCLRKPLNDLADFRESSEYEQDVEEYAEATHRQVHILHGAERTTVVALVEECLRSDQGSDYRCNPIERLSQRQTESGVLRRSQ